jgi:hypothetical protein
MGTQNYLLTDFHLPLPCFLWSGGLDSAEKIDIPDFKLIIAIFF